MVCQRAQGLLVIGGPVAPDQVGSERGGRGLPEEDQDVGTTPWGELEAGLEHAARIQPGANGARERVPRGEARGCLGAPVAAEELGPIGGPGSLDSPQVQEGDPASELGVPRVARQERPRPGLERRDDVRRGRSPRGPQGPFRIGGHGQAPGTVGTILDGQQ